MGKDMHLIIKSKEGITVETDAAYVDVPMVNGRYGFLYNHAPLMGVLKAGKVRYDADGEQKFIDIDGGFVKVENNMIEILH